MRWREAGALVVWAFNLVPGFPGGWVQYIYLVGLTQNMSLDISLGSHLLGSSAEIRQVG